MAMKASEDIKDPTLSLVTSTTPGDGRRKRQATKKTKGVEGLPPCLICGEPASGLHYGVNSCSACKAFFFRNWMRRDHLVCEGDGNCVSTPGSGLGCPACRMKRCLKAGMSLTGTRRGRYTHETRVKIKRDAKKMLGDDTIKASVTSSVRKDNSPASYYSKTQVPPASVNEVVTEVAPMDCLNSQDKDLRRFISYLPPTTSQEEWGISSAKIDEISDENVQFYEDLSLQPLDLTKGDLSTTESIGSYDENPTNVSSAIRDKLNAKYDHSTSPPSFIKEDSEGTSQSFLYEPQSFLSLMNLDSEESRILQTTEPKNLSKESEFRTISQPPPAAPLYSDIPDIQNTNCPDLQVIQPSMLSSKNDDDEDDYTKLQNIIAVILSTPKTARLKLKSVAESVTVTYKRNDYYPEGFLESVADIQRNFLEQKALKTRVFGDMKTIPHEEYLQIYQTTGLDIDGRKALVEKHKMRYEEWYLNYIKFAKSLPYFQDLPVQDQISILKAAKTQYVALCDYQAFDADKLLYTDNTGETYDIDDFNKVFSPVYISTMAEFVRALKSLNLTEDERNVMKSICLFTPEYCVTDVGREKAKEQYVQLINVLAYLLIENHGEDPTFQYRLLQVRELSKIFSKMDMLEKWNAFSLYAEDPGSVPIAMELFSPTKKGTD